MSRKNIYNEFLTDEDFKNIKELHEYSKQLQSTLNQLSQDLNNGRLKWGELSDKGSTVFSQEVDNISKESFSNLEQNFHEYAGLIYDGAYSEHLINNEKSGLTGDNISEEIARQKVEEFVEIGNIKEILNIGYSQNAKIPLYTFSVEKIDGNTTNISISEKGGNVVYMNSNRDVNKEIISQDEANNLGKDFLNKKGFKNMQATYYLKQNGIVTINYASIQDNVILYPDLIKVKVALDNGEVLGIETMGYVNNNKKRNFSNIKISQEEAKKSINKNLKIIDEGLALIPTEYKTEILCYEFKGIVDEREFLVYINVENGREEDTLIITDTPNGVLAM